MFSATFSISLARQKGSVSAGGTRLHKRSAEGGETEPEGVALALEREVRRETVSENREALGWRGKGYNIHKKRGAMPCPRR
jgi:hypothetical protein